MNDRMFGPYRLEELIGRGGMGEVYRAFDTRRERFVALKRLPDALALNPEYRARFQKESALAAQLREPHIIPIHDYGEIDGSLFIDMRLVDGLDLSSVLSRGRLTPVRAVDIISQVADALDAAHAAKLVHRDVKPSNVLLTRTVTNDREFAYLIDFGIARPVDGPRMTQLGMPVGTRQYMAPELFNAGEVSRRVDVYALACVLYECLTGRLAHPAESWAALLSDLKAEPPRPSEIVPGLPVGFDTVIAGGLAYEPVDRYPSAGLFAARARSALSAPAAPHVSRTPWPIPLVPSTPSVGTPSIGTPPVGTASIGTPPVGTASVGTASVATPPVGMSSPGGPGSVTSTPPRTPLSTPQPAPRPADTSLPADGTPPSAARETDGTPAPRRRFARLLLLLLPAVLAIVAASVVVDQVDNPVTIDVGRSPAAAAMSPDGRALYIADRDSGSLYVLDVRTRAEIGSPIKVGDQPCDLVVSPNGSQVWVANRGSGSVTVIDTTSGQPGQSIAVGSEPSGLAMSRDGRRLYVANQGANSVTVIDTALSEPTGVPIPVGLQPAALAISPDGSQLYVASRGADSVSVIDTASGTTIDDPIRVGSQPVALAMSPDGQHLYVANHGSGSASVIETPSGMVIRDGLPAGDGPSAVAVRPDGRRVYLTGQNSDTMSTFDPITNEQIGDAAPAGDNPVDVMVTPDSETVIVVDQGSATVSFRAA